MHDVSMSRRSLFFSTALLVVLVLDQVLRVVALRRVAGWHAGPVEFGYYPNAGAIFSWPVPVAVMTVITGAILVGLAWFLWSMRLRRGEWFALGLLSMLAAGAANFVDRLRFSSVVDYVSVGPWFPVFNLADVVIVVGLIMVVWPRRNLTDTT